MRRTRRCRCRRRAGSSPRERPRSCRRPSARKLFIGDAVRLRRADRRAVDLDRRRIDPAARGPRAVVGVGEAVGDLEHAVGARRRVVELLLEQPSDHVAGHRLDDERVGERLHGERLAVGDLARRSPPVCWSADQVGADPARVHERDDRAARRDGLVASSCASAIDVAERSTRRAAVRRAGRCRP